MRTSILILALLAPLIGSAQEVTEPYGFNTITCPANSDTIVGVPFRPTGSRKGTLNALPTVDGEAATLSIAGTPGFTVNGFANTWYAKFSSGTKNGRFYTITANDASTLTIDLNGDNMTGVLATDTVVIAQYWTLDSLFPPAGATTAWTGTAPNTVPNGHAIVASTSTSAPLRKTQLLLPNTAGTGTNLAPNRSFYIYHNTVAATKNWLSASGTPAAGSTILSPDCYIIIRHPSTVPNPTTLKTTGEVETGTVSIPLSTITTGFQDNYIALVRPIDLTLTQLNLYESGAFVASSSTSPVLRKDQILVFNNAVALRNKAPSASYYHNGTDWLNASGNTNANLSVIPAGAGFIIRKAKTSGGATHFWNNGATY